MTKKRLSDPRRMINELPKKRSELSLQHGVNLMVIMMKESLIV